MKNSSRIKAGKHRGNPGYRTSSTWRGQVSLTNKKWTKKNPSNKLIGG